MTELGVNASGLPLYQADPVRCFDGDGCWWPHQRVEGTNSGTVCELDHVCWLVERARIAKKNGMGSRPAA